MFSSQLEDGCEEGGESEKQREEAKEITKIGINLFYRRGFKKGSLKCNEDVKYEVFSSHLKDAVDGCFQLAV